MFEFFLFVAILVVFLYLKSDIDKLKFDIENLRARFGAGAREAAGSAESGEKLAPKPGRGRGDSAGADRRGFSGDSHGAGIGGAGWD